MWLGRRRRRRRWRRRVTDKNCTTVLLLGFRAKMPEDDERVLDGAGVLGEEEATTDGGGRWGTISGATVGGGRGGGDSCARCFRTAAVSQSVGQSGIQKLGHEFVYFTYGTFVRTLEWEQT
jgi:hypothetical protein